MTPPVATPAEGHAAISAPWTQASWVQAWPIYPLLLFVLLLFVYPVAQILVLSLFDASGAPTAANYARIATTPVYLQTLVITFEIAGWTTFFALLAGYPVAYLMANAVTRTRDSLTLLVLMPFWTSFLVRTFAWMILLGRNGAVNRLLLTLGITDAPVALIFNFTGVMIGSTHIYLPFMVLMLAAAIRSVPRDVEAAAATLGSSRAHVFFAVTLPLTAPGVLAGSILVFVLNVSALVVPRMLGGPTYTVMATLIYDEFMQLLDWPSGAALSFALSFIAVGVIWISSRLARRWAGAT
jgi:putative spermidine/putrescine transport system permease protein